MIKEIVENDIQPVPQSGQGLVFKRRTPEMSNIQDVEDISKLYDHIRMLDAEGYPSAYLETREFKLEFSRASLKSDNSIIADVRITKK